MFSRTALLAVASTLLPAFVSAQVAEWGQCGGQGYTGSTTCASGLACVYSNPYYSQCLPSSSSASSSVKTTSTASTSATKTTSTTSKTSTTTTATSSSASASATSSVTGYVTVKGQSFYANGAEFTVVGANSYWVGLMGYSTADINTAFANIAATGATTVRTWGFNDVTTSTKGEYSVYYQLWDNGVPTINTGANGLESFDNVVALAKANGLRLIVALTNNWSDYGGMDVYNSQLIGSSYTHDEFYTNATVIAAYKNYIKEFVTRYLNEPGILAWELANEPRCAGSSSTASSSCSSATITAWAKEISAYIKSIDSNHLVAIGDEGFFNEPSASTYPYQAGGSIGIDFVANLNIDTLDFGTFHNYPNPWGQGSNETLWGEQWIIDHANAAAAAGKPAIMEEFGVTDTQEATYTVWWNTVISSGLAGDLIWQAGSDLSNGDTPNDGYAVYPGTDVYTLETEHAAALKAARA